MGEFSENRVVDGLVTFGISLVALVICCALAAAVNPLLVVVPIGGWLMWLLNGMRFSNSQGATTTGAHPQKDSASKDSAYAEGVSTMTYTAKRDGGESPQRGVDFWRADWPSLKEEMTEKAVGKLHREPSNKLVGPTQGVESLIAAVSTGDISNVRSILKQGTDPNVTEKATGWTPLMRAAYRGDLTVVNSLMAWGARPDKEAINLARNRSHTEIAKILEARLQEDGSLKNVGPDKGRSTSECEVDSWTLNDEPKLCDKTFCPSCGKESFPGASFCVRCGTRLAKPRVL